MKSKPGSKTMIAGVLIILVLGWWTLRGYTLYTSCVREKVNEVDRMYITSAGNLNSSEYQNAVERAILGCSTHGMEIAGAGVFVGLLVFVIGVVKSFLDKKAIENSQVTSNQIIINGNASGSNIILGNENDVSISPKEDDSQ